MLEPELPALTAEEIERYARHIVLQGVGGPGQQKIRAARVLVIGAGGLGAPLLEYLAAAGVGVIGIVDDDMVSLSNLQRQVIHSTHETGQPKTASAARRIAQINPGVKVEQHQLRLDADNAMGLIRQYDVIADGSDNFATRYLVSDSSYHARKPLVTGAIGAYDGSVTTLRPYENGPDGTPNPTYRCLFPDPPPEGMVPACSTAGVLGALPGMIGSIMAMEVLRQITGFGEGLTGRLLLADTFSMRFETMEYGWDPANPLNGEQARKA